MHPTVHPINRIQRFAEKGIALFSGLFSLALLFALSTQPVHAGGPAPRFAYVFNQGSNTAEEFSITPGNGVLVPLVGCPANPYVISNAAVVDSTDRFVYDASGTGNVYVSSINPIAGCLTLLAISPTAGLGPQGIVITPNNQYLYVSDNITNNIDGFTINPATGLLAAIPGSPWPAGPSPDGIAVDPTGTYLYVANDVAAGSINGFTIGPGGALGGLAGFPVAIGAKPSGLVIDPNHEFLLVTLNVAKQLLSYRINPANGTLFPPKVAATLAGPLGVAISPIGQTVFVADNVAGKVSGFLVNPGTGGPAVNGNNVVGFKPMGLTIDRSGNYLYVAVNGANTVHGFSINPNTGLLAPIPGSPWPAGLGPSVVVTTP